MKFLLDANVLIDANRDYYPIDRVPEFWDWLLHLAVENRIGVVSEVYDELVVGTDGLTQWASDGEVSARLLLDEEPDLDLVSRVIDEGYADDLTDAEVEKLGRDPFLIAYALAAPRERVVVTTEGSKPGKQRANRKIPDVCNGFGIRAINTFEMIKELDFHTSWKRPS